MANDDYEGIRRALGMYCQLNDDGEFDRSGDCSPTMQRFVTASRLRFTAETTSRRSFRLRSRRRFAAST